MPRFIDNRIKRTCSVLSCFASFSLRRTSTMYPLKWFSRSRFLSMPTNRSSLPYFVEKSLNNDLKNQNVSYAYWNRWTVDDLCTYLPCRLAASRSVRKSSRFWRSFLRISRCSSSARTLTYFSKHCLRSRDVNSRYRWSKTILWSSFSHVLNADTYKWTKSN